MSDKFSYFDFLMYLLPGATFFLEIIGATYLIWPNQIKGIEILGESGLLASILFILISFILGNSVQIIANTAPQNFLKKKFWNGRWPSSIALLNKSLFFKEIELKNIKDKLLKINAMTESDVLVLNVENNISTKKEDLDKATELSQALFDFVRYSLIGTEAGNKIQASEAQYQFCRGMFTSFGIGSFLFFISAILNIKKNESFLEIASFSFIALAALCYLFFWRTRGVGKGWVVMTFRSVFAIKDEEPPSNQNYIPLLIGCKYKKQGIK